jgi:hypothetical protein
MYRNIGGSREELESLKKENTLLKQENAALVMLVQDLRGMVLKVCSYLERRWE